MFKRPHYLALVFVVLFVAVLFRLPSQTLGNLKLAIGGMFLPLFGLASSSHTVVDKAAKTVVPRRVLIEENQRLRQTNQILTAYLQQYQEIWRENERLRRLVGWQKQSPYNLKLGRIVTRDPANWWHSVQIDLGKHDGLRTNLPVLAGDGSLVGRIQAVGDTRSQVILLGDPNLRVAASIQPSGETGIIQTISGPEESDMVELDFLPGTSSSHPGQSVQTSGDGGLFPKGIPIGKIVDLRSKDYGLTSEARVKLTVNLTSLEEVWVILQ